MKIAIRYYTKSKKGNTFKLASVVSEVTDVEALTVDNDLTYPSKKSPTSIL